MTIRLIASVRAFMLFATIAVISALFTVGNSFAQQPPGDGAGGDIEASLNVWEKQLVQEGLTLLGFYNGFADGTFGSKTREALAKYQSENNRPGTGRLSPKDALDLGGAALTLQEQLDWQPLDRSLTGISISYPAGLLTERTANKVGGEDLSSENGRVALKTVSFRDASKGALNDFYNSLANAKDTTVTYQLKRSNWFILSGISGDRKFYSRFEQRGNEIKGYDFSWNADEPSKAAENISVMISNSFYPFGRDVAAGKPSYPMLLQLTKQDAQSKQQPAPNSQATETSKQTQPDKGTAEKTSQTKEDGSLVEQKEGALPPPSNGSLVTEDGKGLRFVYHYFPPQNSKYDYAFEWAKRTHLFLNIPEIDAIDGIFVTPRPLNYVTRECGTINAFYDSKNSAIFVCYELIDHLLEMGKALSKGASDPDKLTVEFVRNNLRFITLHESGHAVIDLLDLPAVGREEDSVDQLAATLLLMNVSANETQHDIARVLQLASVWFKVNSQMMQSPDMATFADEHSLDAQRYFNLLCVIYGRDPENNQAIVDGGLLPKERAARCPEESSKITRSWARLLLPHFAPRFRPKDDNQTPPTSAPASQASSTNPLEWDGKSNPFGR